MTSEQLKSAMPGITDRNIEIPEPLMLGWDKLIIKKKQIRNENYLKTL